MTPATIPATETPYPRPAYAWYVVVVLLLAYILAFIDREAWAEYLHWLRAVLDLPVKNETRVGAMRWDAANGCFLVPITTGSGPLGTAASGPTGASGNSFSM